MAKKRLGNVSKLLGGLGAMYAFSKLPVGKGVRLGDPDADRRMAEDRAKLSRRPLYEPSDAEQAERARENARRLAGLPVLTPEQQAAHLSEFPEIVRSSAGPVRTTDGFLTTQQRKKGGKVSSGSKTVSASRRGDGIAQRGKTRGRMV